MRSRGGTWQGRNIEDAERHPLSRGVHTVTDYEIAKATELKPIKEVAERLGIDENELEYYGKYKAKIRPKQANKDSKVILVTATSPTKYGEGKTTVSVGLIDGLSRLGKKVCGALREPSLGPVFGVKGGATGGGKTQIAPMDDINLHFTGDLHAITAATNLLAAMIDKSIFHKNPFNIDPERVVFNRCLDINDRALRSVKVAGREDSFTLTAASEIMAILCLAKDEQDLQRRLGDILIGYTFTGSRVYCRDLKAEGALMVLLKDAIKPNLVQTLEHNPVLVHGGPFANIAHGCNSIIATNTALGLADYVVTEAGFGADLGAEKFFDIKCRSLERFPDCVVLVTSIRSIKYNAGDNISDPLVAIREGFSNLLQHYSNLTKSFNVPVIVAVNKFPQDTPEEISEVSQLLSLNKIPFEYSNGYAEGGAGTINLANHCINLIETSATAPKYLYDLSESISCKIDRIASEIYHAKEINYSEEASRQLEIVDECYRDYPVCIAKTQYSFTDDPKKLGAPTEHTLHVDKLLIRNGAKFIVAVCGGMMLMPGLPKDPAASHMSYEDGVIEGLF